jgi:hypothetical protein
VKILRKLIAKRPIIYYGKMYRAGDCLPVNDNKILAAWLAAGSAEWTGGETAAPADEAPAPAAEDVLKMKKAELAALLTERGIEITGNETKQELIALLTAE